MPAARPRMHVTPSEQTHRLLTELSKLTGKPPATIVRELLDEATPALQMTVDAFQTLRDRPEESEAAVHRLAAKAHAVIAQATLDLDNDRKPGPKPGAKKKPGRGAAKT